MNHTSKQKWKNSVIKVTKEIVWTKTQTAID